jgi:LTXXQ motif family protein
MRNFVLMLAAALLAGLFGASEAPAQQPEQKAGTPAAGLVLIPGAMRGFGTMGPTGYRRLCAALSVGLYEWRVQWVDRLVRPTDAQKALLDELLTASTKARETIAAACPKEPVETTIVQLSVMERRVTAVLDAIKTVRPVYEKFYASLDAAQRARLDALGPGAHGWRW